MKLGCQFSSVIFLWTSPDHCWNGGAKFRLFLLVVLTTIIFTKDVLGCVACPVIQANGMLKFEPWSWKLGARLYSSLEIVLASKLGARVYSIPNYTLAITHTLNMWTDYLTYWLFCQKKCQCLHDRFSDWLIGLDCLAFLIMSPWWTQSCVASFTKV